MGIHRYLIYMENLNKSNEAIVVSSHYNEDLSWINSVKYPVKVYSKTIKDENFIDFNKAQEVPAYLKYIIENYYNLPEYSIFVHGHLEAFHQADSIINLINNVVLDKPIIDLNANWRQEIYIKDKVLDPTLPHCDEKNDFRAYWLRENWNDFFGEWLPLPDLLSFLSCAQFVIHKSCIVHYPIEFWEHLFDACKKTKLENYISGRIFEYTWYYIFSRKADFLRQK